MRSASANTASMSCSISRMVRPCLSSRSIVTARADSSGPRPAIGSSKSSKRGLVASAIASSSWRCSPWLSRETSASARPPRPTRSSAARAGTRNAGSRRASPQKRNEWPACACTANATLSSALKSGNSDVIWNERARPRALRPWVGSGVMSWRSNQTRPASGASSPPSWAISVLLPAPLGPMMACSSPGATSSMMSSEAITPPKRLVRPSTRRSGSATAEPREKTIDPAARIQDDQQDHRAEDDRPIFGEAGQPLLQHQKRDRADHRADHRAHPAQHRHHDEIARARPMHDGGTDEGGVVGEQHAGQPADGARDHETDEPVAEGWKTDRAHAPVVRARALDHHAEARIDDPPDPIDDGEQQPETQIVELHPVGEVDRIAERAALVDGETVVAAIAVEADRDVIDHLREGERDHDEIDAAGAQAERPDREREEGGRRQRERPLDEAGADAFLGEDPHHVSADPQIGGMPEAHHAAESHDQVEAHRRHGEDEDAGEQRHQEIVAGQRTIHREQPDERQHAGRGRVARREPGGHRPDAGKRPSGRKTRIAAISM